MTAPNSTPPSRTTTPLGLSYRKLFAATTISNLGDGMAVIAYPWLASAITRNPLLIALVLVASKEEPTKKKEMNDDQSMREEYDLAALRVRRVGPGRTHFKGLLVALEPDVAAAFPDAQAVNKALRGLIASPKKRRS